MSFRCAIDYFGYCPSPEFDVESNPESLGGHCRLDPKTCGKYQTHLQNVRRIVDETKDRLDDWPQHKGFVKLLADVEKLEAEAEVS